MPCNPTTFCHSHLLKRLFQACSMLYKTPTSLLLRSFPVHNLAKTRKSKMKQNALDSNFLKPCYDTPPAFTLSTFYPGMFLNPVKIFGCSAYGITPSFLFFFSCTNIIFCVVFLLPLCSHLLNDLCLPTFLYFLLNPGILSAQSEACPSPSILYFILG